MTVRCKFTCQNIVHAPYLDTAAGDSCNASVVMGAAYAFATDKEGNQIAENRDVFGKWTPSASLTMNIRNEKALAQFEIGRSFYVDFSPAD